MFINSLCYTRFTKMITGKNDSGTVTEKTLSDKLLQSMSDQIPMFVAIGLLLIPIDGGDQSEVKETNHRFYSISPLDHTAVLMHTGLSSMMIDDKEADEIEARNHLFNQNK